MTVGPWRPIYLKCYTASIDDLDVRADVTPKLDCSLSACVTFAGAKGVIHNISAVLRDFTGRVVREESRPLSASEVSIEEASVFWEFKDGEVELWWPIKYGKQALYTLEVTVLDKVLPSMSLNSLLAG